jgi:DNA uptake protein ComE-like DNA-binding protein
MLMGHKSNFVNPYYRFRSLAELQRAADLGVRIDVNKASIDDWLRLPGLSIHQAQLLAQLLEQGVQFFCLEDIAAVLNLPLHHLLPFGPILEFCYYAPDELGTPQRTNPNLARTETLAAIPGISMKLAREIVRDRLTQGPYQNLADFQRRLDLSGAQIQALLSVLIF